MPKNLHLLHDFDGAVQLREDVETYSVPKKNFPNFSTATCKAPYVQSPPMFHPGKCCVNAKSLGCAVDSLYFPGPCNRRDAEATELSKQCALPLFKSENGCHRFHSLRPPISRVVKLLDKIHEGHKSCFQQAGFPTSTKMAGLPAR